MNDIYITLTGNVASEPRQYSFDESVKVTSLRVLTTHRFFDKKTGQWADGEKVCFTVRCWRALGENVAASIRAGHPVVVSGKLRIREFGAEGDRRFMPEIEASAVGHDLRWGTGAFTKPERGGAGGVSKEMRDRLDEETRDWAMGPRPQRSLANSTPHEELNPFHTLDATTGTERPPTTENSTTPTPAAIPTQLTETASTPDPAQGTMQASGPDSDTPQTSEGTSRKKGAKNGILRALEPEAGTVRVPSTAGDKRRDAQDQRRDTGGGGDERGGKHAGADDKQLTMTEKAAA
ncbi:single-stranded DNA-binding protein [Nonomuraea gerenzanensis]|uniref:Single-stranded DNA-binding protein n=1 Tax=Nonomuraea gerenzanensis TaxID=93944 RepID=A0A1M4ELI3_9ACTN|nr:single-stranded DNA-binding protein [Nonomuraea gerenzanensis]UBU11226.1 single-stranded DNA-binding protein [Nonomuraea gerenzanensis]SBO99699.1 Single-stranded DNA-binding protein [Nonomuraea gerenzanensis]